MKKWRLVGGVTLVFVLGVVVGSQGTYLYQRHWSEHIWKDPSARKAAFLQKLTRELRLTDAQEKEFRQILDEMDSRMEMLIRERGAQVRKNLDEGFSRMKERLDPDQQEKLEELRARFERRLKERKTRHPLTSSGG